ncbi:unnamed protein product, partial [Coregonus sp. 'balchen']
MFDLNRVRQPCGDRSSAHLLSKRADEEAMKMYDSRAGFNGTPRAQQKAALQAAPGTRLSERERGEREDGKEGMEGVGDRVMKNERRGTNSKTAMSPAGFSSQWTSGVQEAWSAHSVSYPRASLHYPAHHHLHHHPTHTSYAYCLRQPAERLNQALGPLAASRGNRLLTILPAVPLSPLLSLAVEILQRPDLRLDRSLTRSQLKSLLPAVEGGGSLLTALSGRNYPHRGNPSPSHSPSDESCLLSGGPAVIQHTSVDGKNKGPTDSSYMGKRLEQQPMYPQYTYYYPHYLQTKVGHPWLITSVPLTSPPPSHTPTPTPSSILLLSSYPSFAPPVKPLSGDGPSGFTGSSALHYRRKLGCCCFCMGARGWSIAESCSTTVEWSGLRDAQWSPTADSFVSRDAGDLICSESAEAAPD